MNTGFQRLLTDDAEWQNFIDLFDGDDQEHREAWAASMPPLVEELTTQDAEDTNGQ